ncbi:MerR family transcriptional regulator [Saccharopolyspora subtropica]|uniref:MerR family transcriptional regulator n=1 Tax=Saccharopolyspora thermophila TaxID=89367 RepID=A0A917JU58_9PSEU|nr:MerR family transcriptional regulator [Saccharopolyspora subtropica]GGI84402.1 MerR family transcriptional regulator [Saccharopolyspora subtropica]
MPGPVNSHRVPDAFDDVDYPAYTMGRAAEMLGVTPDFLRSLEAAGLLAPKRSTGGHRRYSRTELTLAARVRELLDDGLTVLTATCRIVELERELHAARARIAELEKALKEGGARRRSR